MEERENKECWMEFTQRATKDENNQLIDVNYLSDLDGLFCKFARGWIKKIQDPKSNIFERFIYLWMTFNSWLSMVVPDDSKNDQDRYLLDTIAGSERFGERFDDLWTGNDQFQGWAEDFAGIGPVFKVIWLKNNGIPPWNEEKEERREYVKMVLEKNPYKKSSPQFFPSCSFKRHISDEGDVQIPIDWPHIVHMIYQVRCNLFHGGKAYDSSRDRIFVELAFNILWAMFQEEGFIGEILQDTE
jgi:hypothetical protein